MTGAVSGQEMARSMSFYVVGIKWIPGREEKPAEEKALLEKQKEQFEIIDDYIEQA